jgi:hypothetical protein
MKLRFLDSLTYHGENALRKHPDAESLVTRRTAEIDESWLAGCLGGSLERIVHAPDIRGTSWPLEVEQLALRWVDKDRVNLWVCDYLGLKSCEYTKLFRESQADWIPSCCLSQTTEREIVVKANDHLVRGQQFSESPEKDDVAAKHI